MLIAVIQIALLLVALVASIFEYCVPCIACVVCAVAALYSSLSMAWFIWGVIVLVNHECYGTIYFYAGVAIVTLNGAGMVTGACYACDS